MPLSRRGARSAFPLRDLTYGQHLIRRDVFEHLRLSARPKDFDPDRFRIPDAEMHARMSGRRVPRGGGEDCRLWADSRYRANGVAVAARALQPEDDPVVPSGAAVLPDLRSVAQCGRDDVEPPVPIQIRGDRAAMRSPDLEIRPELV